MAPNRLRSKWSATGVSVLRWSTLALLACGLAASASAQIVVYGSYSSTQDYWTGGGGTKNGTVGGTGDGQLVVAGGSVLNLKNAYFGSGTTGGNTASITLFGSGSRILISNLFFLGNNAGHGIMSISEGGYLHTTSTGSLGAGSAGVTGSGTMTIDGLGSLWEAGSTVNVGQYSSGTLTIENQGAFSGTILNVAAVDGSTGTLNVTGNGATEHSTVTLSSALNVSSGGSAFVSNGGQIHAGAAILIEGSLVVDGSGSAVTTGDAFYFYIRSAEGVANVTVQNGASVDTYYLDLSGNDQSGTLTVTGSGSKWQTTTNTHVGQTGGTGELNVLDGGSYETGKALYIGSDSTLDVRDSGSFLSASSISNSGTFQVRDGGTVETVTYTNDKQLTIESGAMVTVTDSLDQGDDGRTIVDGGSLIIGKFGYGGGIISISDPADGTALTIGDPADPLVYVTFQYGVIEDYTSGPGSISKVGINTIHLAGANTFSGTTKISSGKIQIGNTLALQNSTVLLATNNGLDLNGYDAVLGGLSGSGNLSLGSQTISVGGNGADTTYSGVLSGAGALTKLGDGTLTLTGNNTFAGLTSIESGTLQLGNGGTNGTLAGAIDVDGALVVNRSNSLTLSQQISGTGTVKQAGSGTLILTGDNTYTGLTTIASGKTLQIGNSADTGSIVGDVANAGTLIFKRSDAVTYDGVISDSGKVEKAGGGTLTLTGDQTYTGKTTISAGTLRLGDGGTTGSIASASVANATTLVFDRSDEVTFDGVISGSGKVEQAGGGTLIFTGDHTYTGQTTISSGTLQLGAGGTSGSIASASVVNDGSLVFNRSDAGLALSGLISGTGAVAQIGTGTTTLSGANTYTGATTISAGTLKLGHVQALQNSTVSVGVDGGLDLNSLNATLGGLAGSGSFALGAQSLTVGGNGADTTYSGVLSGTGGSLTKTGDGTLTLSGDNTYTGATTISGGMLQLGDGGTTGSVAGDIVNDGTLVIDRSNAVTVSGVISGTGDLAFTGSNTTTLNAANTFTGTTTIESGFVTLGKTLALQNSTLDLSRSYSLNLNNNHATLGALKGSGHIAVTGGHTLTVGGNGADTLYSGAIQGGGSFRKQGAGTMILTGNNSYTGGTTLTGGTLQIGDGGTNGQISGDVTNNAALVFNRSDDLTYAGVISGTGSLTQAGAGTLVLTGDNTYAGGTSISAGTLQLGDGGTTGSVAGDIANGGSLVVNRSDALTLSGIISGTGGLTKEGAGTLTLTGDNTYTGDTTIAGGTLQLGEGNTSGSILGNVIVGSGSTLTFNQYDFSFGGDISGSGGVTQSGPGELTFTGNLTYTGATTISSGLVYLKSAAQFQFSTVAIGVDYGFSVEGFDAILGGLAGNGNLALGSQSITVGGNGEDTVYSGVLSGTGGLTKEGAGTLTLSADNTFTGTTTINAGAINLSAADYLNSSLQNSTVEVNVLGGLILADAEAAKIGALGGSGDVDLADNAYELFIGGNGADTTYSGNFINADFAIIYKEGAGTWTLNGTSLDFYELEVSGGSVVLDGAAGNIARIVNYSGTQLTFQNGAQIAVSNDFAGGSLTVTGEGTDLSVASNLGGFNSLLVKDGANLHASILGLDGSTPVTIDGATLTIAVIGSSEAGSSLQISDPDGGTALIFDVAIGTSYSGTISDYTTGSGSVLKTGAGSLTLSGTNTYTGDTTIDEGAINLSTDDYINYSLQNSTVEVNVDGGLTLAGAQAAKIGALRGSGDVDLANNALELFIGGNGATTTYSGNFINGGSELIYKEGDGIWTLAGTALDFYQLRVDAGAVVFDGAAGTLGRISNETNAQVTFQNGAQIALSSDFAGGSLTITGADTSLSVASNLGGYNSLLVKDGANLHASILGLDGSTPVTVDGATLTIGVIGSSETGSSIQISDPDGGTALIFDVAIGASYSGTISDYTTGSGSVLKTGAGIMRLGNTTSTYSGGTTITEGTISADSGGALGTGAITFDGGTLALTAATSLSQAITVNASGGAITASGAVTLSGDLTVDGTFAVSNGLILDGVVDGGGTFTGAVTVNGTLSPGNSPGTLTFDDNLTLGDDATLRIEIGGLSQGTGYDFLDVAGTATLGGTLEVVWYDGFTASAGDTFTFLTADGGVLGSFGATALPDLGNGLSWNFSQTETDFYLTVLAAVPEPTTCGALAGLAALGATTLRRRRRTDMADCRPAASKPVRQV